MSTPSRPVSVRYQSQRHVSSARHGDTTVLLDVNRGRYYTLNQVGGRIWELLARGSSVPEVVGYLADEFEVDRDQLFADVTRLIEGLQRTKLVVAAAE